MFYCKFDDQGRKTTADIFTENTYCVGSSQILERFLEDPPVIFSLKIFAAGMLRVNIPSCTKKIFPYSFDDIYNVAKFAQTKTTSMRKVYFYKAFYTADNNNIENPVVKYYKAHTDESAMLYAERYERNGDDYKDYGHVSYKLVKVVRVNDDESEDVISCEKHIDDKVNDYNPPMTDAICNIAIRTADVNDIDLTQYVTPNYHPVTYNVGEYTILSMICDYNDETGVLQNIREKLGIETMKLMSVDLSDNFARIEWFGNGYSKDYDYILNGVDDNTDTEYDIAVEKIYKLFLGYLLE